MISKSELFKTFSFLAASKIPNVKLNFNHKLVEADLGSGVLKLRCTFLLIESYALKTKRILLTLTLYFRNMKLEEEVSVEADLVIGADGAHSALRRSFLKQPLFNFNQTYIEHGYKELCIPAKPDGTVSPILHSSKLWSYP